MGVGLSGASPKGEKGHTSFVFQIPLISLSLLESYVVLFSQFRAVYSTGLRALPLVRDRRPVRVRDVCELYWCLCVAV